MGCWRVACRVGRSLWTQRWSRGKFSAPGLHVSQQKISTANCIEMRRRDVYIYALRFIAVLRPRTMECSTSVPTCTQQTSQTPSVTGQASTSATSSPCAPTLACPSTLFMQVLFCIAVAEAEGSCGGFMAVLGNSLSSLSRPRMRSASSASRLCLHSTLRGGDRC